MRIDRILLRPDARAYPLAGTITANLPGVPVTELQAGEPLPVYGPRTLLLDVHRGSFLKRFRDAGADARHVIYQTGCFNRCSYCYLKSYLEHPHLVTVFVNRDDLAAEISREVRSDPGTLFFAGELTDSLLTDDLTGYAPFLVSLFGGLPVRRFELRTKMAVTEPVCSVPPPPNTVLTWTFNPPGVARVYERGAAGVHERLRALVRCREHGYRVGFHLDPLIRIQGWEEAYAGLLETVFKAVSADGLSVISIGTLRFKKELVEGMTLKDLVRTPAFIDEFFPGDDGKYRYFKPLRQMMYRRILGLLGRYTDPARVKIAMEPAFTATDLLPRR